MRKIILIGLVLLTGCVSPFGTYMKDRGNDCLDMVKLSGGFKLGAHADVQATDLFHTGLGIGYGMTTGLYGAERDTGWEKDLHLLVIHRHNERMGCPFDYGKTYCRCYISPFVAGDKKVNGKPNPFHRLFDIEAGATAIMLGARAGFSPGECLDFILGIFTIDLAKDDVITLKKDFPAVESYKFADRGPIKPEIINKVSSMTKLLAVPFSKVSEIIYRPTSASKREHWVMVYIIQYPDNWKDFSVSEEIQRIWYTYGYYYIADRDLSIIDFEGQYMAEFSDSIEESESIYCCYGLTWANKDLKTSILIKGDVREKEGIHKIAREYLKKTSSILQKEDAFELIEKRLKKELVKAVNNLYGQDDLLRDLGAGFVLFFLRECKYCRSGYFPEYLYKYDATVEENKEFLSGFKGWWEENKDYLYWTHDKEGRKLFRVDEEAKKAKIPIEEYRKTHPWPEETKPK